MIITSGWLAERKACVPGIEWAAQQDTQDAAELLRRLSEYDSAWMRWLMVRLATPAQNRLIAIYAARFVLPLWEKQYPHDMRPRRAIEVAEESGDPSTAAETAAWAAARVRAAEAAEDAWAARETSASLAAEAAALAARAAEAARVSAAEATETSASLAARVRAAETAAEAAEAAAWAARAAVAMMAAEARAAWADTNKEICEYAIEILGL
jgi:hypothetical protein